MNLPMELLLVIGVIAFYLQDSMLWLHYDEVALVRTRRGWAASVGARAQLRGRHPYLPNPLMPGRPLFRSGWLSGAGDAGGVRENWQAFVDVLDRFRGGCRVLWLLLLFALPVLLFVYPHPLALLTLLGLVYAGIASLVLGLWRHRDALGLSRRAAASIGFELFCCPPYAINLVRRLSLRRGLDVDAIAAARHLLDDDGRRGLRKGIDARIATALAFHESVGEGERETGGRDGTATRLRRARARLEELQCV
ncbi:hypothetical protein FKV24_013925 [Lysobacter maris]|uniref:Uncharacterized protein n=1 Tax=Marilutibacter maris TaxID=1605891 RepID=A0A508A979_9GAMM|nr:hypothetical protein [Lysobacter maris]KAB8174011.1 hypothetical protein FKV24_013925 [Lysobacter maris]